MTPLENKEIRGLSWKSLTALIIATISICTTVLMSYTSLKAQILESKVEAKSYKTSLEITLEADKKYTELKFAIMEKTLTLLQLQIDNLKK